MTHADRDKLDYEKTTVYFNELHQTRFRLLAALPLATFFAVAFLPSATSFTQEIALGALGLSVVIGLTIYDQRNSMIYDRLIRRANLLERTMGFKPLQIPPRDVNRDSGGAFIDRPRRRTLWRFPIIWHDLGLSIVYAASLAAWCFLLVHGFERSNLVPLGPLSTLAPLAFGILSFLMLVGLAKLNDRENDHIDAWIKDQPVGTS